MLELILFFKIFQNMATLSVRKFNFFFNLKNVATLELIYLFFKFQKYGNAVGHFSLNLKKTTFN